MAVQDYSCTTAVLQPSLCFLFLSMQSDQCKEFFFSASFGSDQQQVFLVESPGDICRLWSLITVCSCQSLRSHSVFVALGKAARVTDEQHLILADLYLWISLPISACHAVSHVSGSPCQRRGRNSSTLISNRSDYYIQGDEGT